MWLGPSPTERPVTWPFSMATMERSGWLCLRVALDHDLAVRAELHGRGCGRVEAAELNWLAASPVRWPSAVPGARLLPDPARARRVQSSSTCKSSHEDAGFATIYNQTSEPNRRRKRRGRGPHMNEKVAAFVPFVDFLGAALGSMPTEGGAGRLSTDPSRSIVKIVNGHVSGRAVGAPATAFSLKMAEQLERSEDCFVSDYVSTTADGRPLQSSSFFIRDGAKVVGILCVNIDPQPFRTLEDGLKAFMEAYRHGGSEEFRDTNLEAVRAADRASSVETLSIGGAETGVAEQVRSLLARLARRRASLTRPAALTSSAGSRQPAPSLSRVRPQTSPASCTSRCRASTATCSRCAARLRRTAGMGGPPCRPVCAIRTQMVGFSRHASVCCYKTAGQGLFRSGNARILDILSPFCTNGSSALHQLPQRMPSSSPRGRCVLAFLALSSHNAARGSFATACNEKLLSANSTN